MKNMHPTEQAIANRPLIFRVIEYGMKHQYFTLLELYRDLNLSENDRDYVWNVLTGNRTVASQYDHILAVAKYNDSKGVFRDVAVEDDTFALIPSTIFNYMDYLELVEARENAKQARETANKAHRTSIAAIIISIAIGLVQIAFELVDKL